LATSASDWKLGSAPSTYPKYSIDGSLPTTSQIQTRVLVTNPCSVPISLTVNSTALNVSQTVAYATPTSHKDPIGPQFKGYQQFQASGSLPTLTLQPSGSDHLMLNFDVYQGPVCGSKVDSVYISASTRVITPLATPLAIAQGAPSLIGTDVKATDFTFRSSGTTDSICPLTVQAACSLDPALLYSETCSPATRVGVYYLSSYQNDYLKSNQFQDQAGIGSAQVGLETELLLRHAGFQSQLAHHLSKGNCWFQAVLLRLEELRLATTILSSYNCRNSSTHEGIAIFLEAAHGVRAIAVST
jgi:hypothetical protein